MTIDFLSDYQEDAKISTKFHWLFAEEADEQFPEGRAHLIKALNGYH
jgi:hypothetical protein